MYNGISMMKVEQWSAPDSVFSSDACLEGCGGFWMGSFFHVLFPSKFKDKAFHITALEVIAMS